MFPQNHRLVIARMYHCMAAVRLTVGQQPISETKTESWSQDDNGHISYNTVQQRATIANRRPPLARCQGCVDGDSRPLNFTQLTG